MLSDNPKVQRSSVMDPANVPSPWYYDPPNNNDTRETPETRLIRKQNFQNSSSAIKTNRVCSCIGGFFILAIGFVLLIIPIYILSGMIEKENKLRLGN